MNVALQSGSSFDATRLRTAGDAGLAMPPLKMVQDSGLPWGLGTDATVVGQINPFITHGLGQRPERCRAAASLTTRQLPASRR